MASKMVVYAVLLLLPMLTATSVAVDQGSMVSNSPGEWCWPGMGYPVYPFPRCRALVKSQCAGGQVVESIQKDCCRQIAAIGDEWCICGALGSMRGSMYKELGVALADDKATVAEVFPGCRTEVMDRAVASLPAVCNQYIPNTNGTDGVCYWLSYYQPPRQMSSR
ncbi:alpha-amylase inhibitor BMAI-1 isoform X2 [Hordeum vulgare subsp. vulgare]|uniref:Bifunctional inhibitor/plant lipid transfer protein/seed storage helical domain-containing protein n=1 Tax=Hordeum vulgare subsp. vulgare TaxID=112509 RepID=A0A8I6WV42_HORVV|nr:alpha-amylase inhibitor BMAI-1 isoform X1 [Hordeum vulgare subsp. vulgare]XP_044968578.1 alpha-amylase inhibitor BMAI-1 isoform X2 [Hordeum vulgare subsp. vulgare]